MGRYQTVHEGHLYIFRKKIEEGKNVLVAIRDVEVDEKNIYNANQVKTLFMLQKEVRRWMYRGFIKIIIIPDIEAICYGRDVGYTIEQIEVPKEIAEISATKLRAEKMKNEESIN